VWQQYPFVWGAVIAAAQLLDATKGAFPFTRMHRAASDLTIAMELICIDAEHEWESIYAGDLPDRAINASRTKLRKLQIAAEQKHFPEGFAPSPKLIRLATDEASSYFSLTYDEDSTP
jgi:hypothetical protein